jgi:putative lipoic acid-binding regulatory protein
MAVDRQNFIDLLNDNHDFPTEYVFKFVMPMTSEKLASEMFADCEVSHKLSKSGKYISFTVTVQAESAEHVVAIYERAQSIPGVMSL